MLEPSQVPLTQAYDLGMLDLDGVVYVGGHAVPRAPEALAVARRQGLRLAYITNNASRPPATVAEHLTELEVPAGPEDVVTSAQAAARVLLERLGPGGRVVCLGAAGLRDALADQGLVAVGVDEDADALVTGYGPDVRWKDIMRAAVRIRDGLWWVASNTDMSIPTPYGTAPGHGVLVDTVRRFSGVEPVVAGKPARPLLEETIRRVGGERPLMIGDRLDTDIAGAHAVGIPSLLVLTGVTGLAELVSAPARERPTHLSPDLDGLLTPHPAVATEEESASCGGWTATVRSDGRITITGAGSQADWWRAVAVAAWQHLDATGAPVDTSDLTVPGPGTGAGGR